MIRVNYTKDENDNITSLTLFPFDESKPSMEITTDNYKRTIKELASENLKNKIKDFPQLTSYLERRMSELENEAKDGDVT